ncbi:MAG TPA: sn-glycerol-3-phosphate ABC transporter ATP-binding protein UgpC [Acidimicrobiales bacterium]
MAEITIRGITKVYDRDVLAVDHIDLDIADEELLVLVGPSGCGKSTLLRMVAGLEEVTDGSIDIGGRDVTYLPPKDRDIAMVFQNYALYPHMTVRRNIGYPLRLAKLDKATQARRVDEVARLLQLEEVLDRRPSQLSGGQRQRVAMGRALVREPQAFLMDEPLSNLDAKLRVEMRAEIARLQRDLGVTTLYVTHDQVEAMTMGTRVAVLDKGRLQQVDTPQRVYDAPVNLFVAAFIGSPAMNLFEGRVVRSGEGADLALDLGTQRIGVDDALAASHPELAELIDQPVVVGIRPEALHDASLEPGVPGDRVLEATVDLVESLGSELVVHLALTGTTTTEGVVGVEGNGDLSSTGRSAVARLSTRSRVRIADTIKLAVDPGGLHVFDASTGASLRTSAPSHG